MTSASPATGRLGVLLPLGLGLLVGDVHDPPGEDDDLLSDVVDIVLGGDLVAAPPQAPRQRVPDDGVPGTTHVDGAGGVGGGVLHVHPEPGCGGGAVAGPAPQDLVEHALDHGRGVDGEVQIAVDGADRCDEPGRLYPGCQVLRDGCRGLPEGLGHREAGHGEIRPLDGGQLHREVKTARAGGLKGAGHRGADLILEIRHE